MIGLELVHELVDELLADEFSSPGLVILAVPVGVALALIALVADWLRRRRRRRPRRRVP